MRLTDVALGQEATNEVAFYCEVLLVILYFFTCKPSAIVTYGLIAVTILCIFDTWKYGTLLQRLYRSNDSKLA